MISWQSLAIAALTVGGVSAGGIGTICIIAGDRVGDPRTAHRTVRTGVAFGVVGLLLLAAAYGVRAL